MTDCAKRDIVKRELITKCRVEQSIMSDHLNGIFRDRCCSTSTSGRTEEHVEDTVWNLTNIYDVE